ncbi:hypothetical protein J6590_013945 [Homalodisca vitripennis]|nr:hypothetical protein J6590_013945 [Homalodisca vitripennis]
MSLHSTSGSAQLLRSDTFTEVILGMWSPHPSEGIFVLISKACADSGKANWPSQAKRRRWYPCYVNREPLDLANWQLVPLRPADRSSPASNLSGQGCHLDVKKSLVASAHSRDQQRRRLSCFLVVVFFANVGIGVVDVQEVLNVNTLSVDGRDGVFSEHLDHSV